MKKTLLISIIISLNIGGAFSQINLVPNPSFEEYDTCPNGTSQILKTTGWCININTSDYYNSCAIYNSMVSVPNTGVGYQCPANGNAFCGFIAYRELQPHPQYREYFGRALSQPLTIGQKYFISLKLNLGSDISTCAINKVGVKFINVNYGDTSFYPTTPIMNNSAHFFSNTIISDTSGWTTITGTYIADSSYQYILIGNFFDNSHTDTSYIFGTWCQSYYFIDDICVSIDSLTCVIPDGPNVCDSGEYIYETNLTKESIIIYPNPTKGNIFIEQPQLQSANIKIYNLFGQLIFEKNFIQKNLEIDLSSYPVGVYLIQLMQSGQVFNKKIILIK
ncbi:MAG: T9SS type A sorting domain-containing protein [Bacteroidales bacterium]